MSPLVGRGSQGWIARLRIAAAGAALLVSGCAADGPSADAPPAVAPQVVRGAPSAFDRIFDDTMARYQLPGFALGVVQDGRPTYVRTAGETRAGSGQPVTPDTLFKIASNSKAMTTGLLARLVDTGKLRWNDPVVRHLPGFRMYDPWVTREMQVRDLLIHNSGLRQGAGDLMFWPEPNLFTRADVIAGLAFLKPQHSFRSRYDYDNLMYVVAGEVAAAAGGAAYEELVRREVFEPLGMARCQAGAFDRDAVGDVAQPHMRAGSGNVPVRTDGQSIPVSTPAAAGGIRCSLADMLKWLALWLDPRMMPPGTTTPWLTHAQREAVWSAHMPMPISARQRNWEGARFSAYGYGWRVSDFQGVFKVAHTGTLMGMYSAVVLLPGQDSGFVFMINGDGSEARTVLTQLLLQQLVAPNSSGTVAQLAAELARERALAAPAEQPPMAARSVASPRAMDSLLGIYRDPWFGDVSICERAGQVQFAAAKSPQLTGVVMDADARRLVDWIEPSVDAEAWLSFAPHPSDPSRVGLSMTKLDPEADFSYDYEDLAFNRVADCR